MPPKNTTRNDGNQNIGASPPSRGLSHGHGQYTRGRTPCGYLVNNTECPHEDACEYSHDVSTITAWISGPGKSSCKHEATCELLQRNLCLYKHPASHRTHTSSRDLKMLEDLTGPERIIDIDSLPKLQSTGSVRLESEKELASFNKLGSEEILVPGTPPRFKPPKETVTLLPDMRNKRDVPFSYPKFAHPFEPLVRAIQLCSPPEGLDMGHRTETDPDTGLEVTDILSDVDMVTNASNLRKLFHLIDGAKRLRERYDVELVIHPDSGRDDGHKPRDILFLSKWTDDPSMNTSLGFGAGFERKTCRYPRIGRDKSKADPQHLLLERSVSHHRVMSYTLGGLRLVVQSEVDAYYCDCHSPSRPPPSPLALRSDEAKRSAVITTPPSSPVMSGFKSNSGDGQRRGSVNSAVGGDFQVVAKTRSGSSSGGTAPSLNPGQPRAPRRRDSLVVPGIAASSATASSLGGNNSSSGGWTPAQPRRRFSRGSNSSFNFDALSMDDPGDSADFSAEVLSPAAATDDIKTPSDATSPSTSPPFTPPPSPPSSRANTSILPPPARLVVHRGPVVASAPGGPSTTTTAAAAAAAAIPAACLLELKTRDRRYEPLVPPQAQLYFSRRPRLFEALHFCGRFEPAAEGAGTNNGGGGGGGRDRDQGQDGEQPETRRDGVVLDMTPDLEAWEAASAATLDKLVALLTAVRDLARERAAATGGEGGGDGVRRSVKLAVVCERAAAPSSGRRGSDGARWGRSAASPAPPPGDAGRCGEVRVSVWSRRDGKSLVPPSMAWEA